MSRISRLLLALACSGALAACGAPPDDAGDAGTPDAGGTHDAGGHDAGSPVLGAPGEPCSDDADCEGGADALCLTDVKGGYCVILGCTVSTNNGCPDHASCVQLDEETTACMEGPCDGDDANCARRGEGFTCLPDENVCWNWDYAPQNPGGDAIGAACTTDDTCESGACYPETFDDGTPTGYGGGYCTYSCSSDAATPCPSGATCVAGLCLDDCGTGDTCREGYVCTGGTCQRDLSNLPLGIACEDDSPCGFGTCLTEVDPDYGVVVTGFPGGYCTVLDECEPGTAGTCGENGTCVQMAAGGTLCAKACNENADCRDGYVCTESACLRAPSTGTGVALGAACTTDTDCDTVAGSNGFCVKDGPDSDPYFTNGYCMSYGCTPASTENGTPDSCAAFGGQCFVLSDYSVGAFCIKSCSSASECRESDGYTCDSDDTCWPDQ